jgi:hypothetical protein
VRRRLAALALTVSVVAGLGPTAVPTVVQAQEPAVAPRSVQFTDEQGDAAEQFDLTQMVGYPRYRGRLVVQLYGPALRVGRRLNGAFVYIDDRGDGRPDYRVSYYLPRDGDGADGLGIARLRGWRSEGDRFGCRGLSARFRAAATLVELHVPRSCLGSPRRVRINGELWNFTRYDRRGRPVFGTFDAVPDQFTFPRRRF